MQKDRRNGTAVNLSLIKIDATARKTAGIEFIIFDRLKTQVCVISNALDKS